jgi:hypothetical protein
MLWVAATPLAAAVGLLIIKPEKEISMDPLTSLVTALAAGAAAALQSTVEQAVKESYAALKELLTRPYTRVPISMMAKPPSVVRSTVQRRPRSCAPGVRSGTEELGHGRQRSG